MPYATEADIVAAYGQNALIVAADRDGDGAADTGVVAQALTDAEALMDSYIGAKYTLPLPSVPAVLKPVCVDAALYRMSLEAGRMTDEIKDRYEKALAWLRDVSRGLVSLGIAEPPASVGGGGVQIVSNTRRLTRDSLKGV